MISPDARRFASGAQCARRFWREHHVADPGAHAEAARRGLAGLARSLHPGGRDLGGGADPMAATSRLLADSSIPALFEAVFEHSGVRACVDVLTRLEEGRFGLRHVSPDLRLRDDVLERVTLELWVLRGCGLEVASVEVLHLSPDYERGPSSVDPAELFCAREVTGDAVFLLSDVEARLSLLAGTRAGAEPEIDPSPHCQLPRRCPFLDHCSAQRPADGIERLPRLRPAEYAALRERGIDRMAQIPEDFPLTPRQARARRAHRLGRAVFEPELTQQLAGLGPPAAYLDFEAATPLVPRHPGMRPRQALPYQWSLHTDPGAGALAHREFLADGGGDPRPAFARALVDALAKSELPVLVYSSFEASVLEELSLYLPEWSEPLRAISSRIVDLLPLVRDGVYHADFGGSFSLKRVAAALAPGFGYDDLGNIREGGAAAEAIEQLLTGSLPPPESRGVRADLAAYCARDTLALVEVHRALRSGAGV